MGSHPVVVKKQRAVLPKDLVLLGDAVQGRLWGGESGSGWVAGKASCP